jgi:uncharacterized repeat protein (TIGR01451 family)
VIYKGTAWEVAGFNPVLDFIAYADTATGVGDTNLATCSIPASSTPLGPLGPELYGAGGCISLDGAFPGTTYTGDIATVTAMCNIPAVTGVALLGFDSDPINGSTTLDPTGGVIPTELNVQAANPLPPPATLAIAPFICLAAVDLSVVKTATPSVNTGGTGTYTITVSNPDAAARDVNVTDTMPAGVTATAVDNGPACGITGGGTGIACMPISVPAASSVVITVDVSFDDTCGNKSNTAVVAPPAGPIPGVPLYGDPNPANNLSTAITNVDCPQLSIVKSVDNAGPVTVGSSVTYSYLVCNDAGSTYVGPGSLVDSNLGVIGAVGPILGGACAPVLNSALTPLNVVTAAPGVCNTATVGGAFGATSNQVCIIVESAFDTTLNGLAKDGDISDADTDSVANLWICKGEDGVPQFPEVDDSGVLCNGLVFGEILNIGPDLDTCNDDDDDDGDPLTPSDGTCADDPNLPGCQNGAENFIPGQTEVDCDGGEIGEGIGAFEVQLKYDHKMFQQPQFNCSQDPFGARWVAPVVSVITENWSLFGCVSKSEPPAQDQIPFVPGEQDFSGYSAFVTMTIQPDLFQRLRPTKDNGVVTDILDENCEVADAFGMPWPGSVQGGLQEDCGDLTITIRMLEGDINLDCEVDVADDQEMAFRYGAFFGNLLYHKFFDLEPNIAPDFDIDIKDLQTVFGRNGSSCDAPIPLQDPQSPVPDP